MNRRASSLIWVLLTLCGGCQSLHHASGIETDHVLVTFPADDTGTTSFGGSKRSYHGQDWPVSLHIRRSVSDIARGHQLRETEAWPIKSLGLLCVVYAVPNGQNVEELVDRLNADERIVTAHPMQQYQGMLASDYDDPLFELQYGEHQESLTTIHSITRGENVRIGIIDSQVDTRHPDLDGQIHKLFALVDGQSVEDQRHGTAVAGIISAAADNGEGLVGLAPAATLHAYAACDQSDNAMRCSSFYLAQALDQAIADKIDVLNLSLAGPQDPLLQRLIEFALNSGMIVVAAENSADPQRNFPASLPHVHAARTTAKPWFARDEQFSTQAGGGYQVFYGSSISSAGITGAAALLRAKYTPEQTNLLLEKMLNFDCTATSQHSLLIANLHVIRTCQ